MRVAVVCSCLLLLLIADLPTSSTRKIDKGSKDSDDEAAGENNGGFFSSLSSFFSSSEETDEDGDNKEAVEDDDPNDATDDDLNERHPRHNVSEEEDEEEEEDDSNNAPEDEEGEDTREPSPANEGDREQPPSPEDEQPEVEGEAERDENAEKEKHKRRRKNRRKSELLDRLEEIEETENEILEKLTDEDEEEDEDEDDSVPSSNSTDVVLLETVNPLTSRVAAQPRVLSRSQPVRTHPRNASLMVMDRHYYQPGVPNVGDLSQYMRTCDNCLVSWDSFQCPLNDMAIELKKWITELEELLSFGCQIEGCEGSSKCCHSRDPAFERALGEMTDMARQMYNTFQSACSNCPMNGGWSEWCEWGACSVSCGNGVRTRTRQCNNPSPKGGGRQCVGLAMDTLPCSGPDCCSDGNWADWSSWGRCSATCGSGMQDRSRTCTNPPPNYCGRTCPGPDKDMRPCDSNIPCCTDGQWSSWNPWSQCPVTCGRGTVERYRTCSSPPPNYCGRTCPGPERDTRSCDAGRGCCVPENGNWGPWTPWSLCSASCGMGLRNRQRSCSNPPPNECGRECPGFPNDSEPCDGGDCCVDGNWGQWQRWSQCSTSCGPGRRERRRRCDSPRNNYCGRECQGPEMETDMCNINNPCQPECVNGNWGPWQPWSGCSATCGTGVQQRMRRCDSPAPNFCGRRCPGRASDSQSCDTNRDCCVDGNWGSWQTWSQCSTSCGAGSRERRRRCDNPRVNYCGRPCPGSEVDRENCFQIACPIVCLPQDGNWSPWSMWSMCTATCGGGRRTRSRTCSNPAPRCEGRPCPGSPRDDERCNEQSCCVPLDGNWSLWSSWTPCSATCGPGSRERSRTCSNPPPNECGRRCPGPTFDTDQCNEGSCCIPEDGNWGSWSQWTRCSVTCGDGTRERSRSCSNPPPNMCGRICPGSTRDVERCGAGSCCTPINGNWSPWSSWSSCSSTCGPGRRDRTRTCSNPPPNECGSTCPGAFRDTDRCNSGECCVDGNWGSWGRWSSSATCGTTVRERRRRCDNPRANDCGRPCPGREVDRETFDTGVPCRICVDGNWGSWGRWSSSVTCGTAVRERRRRCDNPPANDCGRPCPGREVDRDTFDTGVPCVTCVDGNWAPWSRWSPCSSTCGEGMQERDRTCSQPAPNFCGRQCMGPEKDMRRCSGQVPEDGNWGPWTPWSQCSSSCGPGTRDRSRICNNPRPNACGRECPGSRRDTERCDSGACCVDGNWGSWQQWSTPLATCGTTTRQRQRRCDNPRANFCGRDCVGPERETRPFDTRTPCQVCTDGNWGSWDEWSLPAITCGTTTRLRRRRCDEPAANFCGRPCPGPEEERDIFDTEVPCQQCIDGNWGSWDEWGRPSATCGRTTRQRRRRCDNPPANFCGRDCPGSYVDSQTYDTEVPCQQCIDGNWGSWDEWGRPSATCGMTSRQRRRRCDNPPANFCGRDCPGSYVDSQTYDTNVPCQQCIDGNWGLWGPWGPCPVSCGSAVRERRRSCDSPSPNFCGETCPGSAFETALQSCGPEPVDGNWGSWEPWEACSRTCGRGQQMRRRRCNNPPAGLCGRQCPGPDMDARPCDQGPCCVERQWSLWSPWTQCDATCNRGRRTRQRMCRSVGFGQDCGNRCPGPSEDVEECLNLPPCEQPWGPWSACSATCEGFGTRERRRMSFSGIGGLSGQQTERERCQVFFPPCPQPASWTAWKPWCPCDCRKGVRSRRRTCEQPGQVDPVDISLCGGPAREEEYCDVRPHCPLCATDCRGKVDGRYPSCTSCNDYLECSNGQTRLISCTGNNYEYDAFIQKCVSPPSPSCSLVDCVSSCVGLDDGRYPSCFGCDTYVECRGGRDSEQSCPVGQEFNAHSGQCGPGMSPTCVRAITRNIDFMISDAPADSYFPDEEELDSDDRKKLYKELIEKAGVAAKYNRTEEDILAVEDEEEEEEEEMKTKLEGADKEGNTVVIEEDDKENGKEGKEAKKHEKDKGFKCQSDCSNVKPGVYQSCNGCSFYILCTKHGVAREIRCPHKKVWDDKRKKCKRHSRTCKSHKRENQTRP